MIYCVGDCHIGLFSETENGFIPNVFYNKTWKYEHMAKQKLEDTLFTNELFLSKNSNFKLARLDAPTAFFSSYNKNLQGIIEYIIGCKEYNKEKDCFIFSFGEIDCGEKIIKKVLKNNQIDLLVYQQLIIDVIFEYFKCIIKYINKYNINIIVYGPPPSAVFNDNFKSDMIGTNYQRNIITKAFNDMLMNLCQLVNIKFITLFYDCVDDNLITISKFLHENNSHVNPKHCWGIIKKQLEN